ncbi:MAG: MerR family transcriptional regulator, partial [Gammaproteobacteria bacterium]
FSLNEIHGILKDSEKGRSPCAHVRSLMKHKIDVNRKKIQSMQQSLERMQAALEQWESMPDGIPDGHSICSLIESTIFLEDNP